MGRTRDMDKALALALALTLAGCATVYQHPTKGERELQVDAYECERDAAPVQNMIRAQAMFDRCLAARGWTPDRPF